MVTFSSNSQSFTIIMHAASGHFGPSKKKEGFYLALLLSWNGTYIFVEWMLSAWFWHGLILLSSVLTFLVSSSGLNPPPSWWGILLRNAIFGVKRTWVQVLVLNPCWTSFLLCEMEMMPTLWIEVRFNEVLMVKPLAQDSHLAIPA